MNQSKFTRGARWVIALTLLLLLANVAQLFYRFTLPTDGWFVRTTDVDNADWKFESNLVGAPSNLQAGDILQTVDDVSTQGTASNFRLPAPAGWRAGNSVTYTVARGDQIIAVNVPVVHWTPAAVWLAQVTSGIQVLTLLSDIFLLALASLTFLRRPDVLAARALLFFAVAIACPALSGLVPDGTSVAFDPLAFAFTTFYSYSIYAILVGPTLVAFSLYFPKPKAITERHPILLWLPVGLALLGGVLFINLVLQIVPMPVAVLWFLALGCIVITVINLVHSSFSIHDPIGRAQMRWAGSGFGFGLAIFALNFPASFHWVGPPLDLWILALTNLATPVIGIGVSIAILRYRLFDIDVIIRRTLTYALVTALLAIIFFSSVVILQQVFSTIFGQTQNELITVLSTLAIAALFVPVRNRIQGEIDKRFNRKKYDAQQVLNDFGKTVRDETDLEALTARLMEVVDETMQPKTVSVWLQDTDNKRRHV